MPLPTPTTLRGSIGIFDSGIGGLIVAQSLISALPQYSYLYLGDTARLPYGNRSQEMVYQFTKQAVQYLFEQGCLLVILACNTASAEALRRLQHDYLPEHYPERRVLGVIIPTVEATIQQTTEGKAIGVLATTSTVESEVYLKEVLKLQPEKKVYQVAAPLLVPLIEFEGDEWLGPVVASYLKRLPLSELDTLILGCTHYAYIKDLVRSELKQSIQLISQDELLPSKVEKYLQNHPEIATQLSKESGCLFQVTDLTSQFSTTAARLFGQALDLQQIKLGL